MTGCRAQVQALVLPHPRPSKQKVVFLRRIVTICSPNWAETMTRPPGHAGPGAAGHAGPGPGRSGWGPSARTSSHPAQGLAQLAERDLVLADQAHAPGERVAAAVATPRSTSVSSTRRSDCRRRVITGTDNVVNITFRLLQMTSRRPCG